MRVGEVLMCRTAARCAGLGAKFNEDAGEIVCILAKIIGTLRTRGFAEGGGTREQGTRLLGQQQRGHLFVLPQIPHAVARYQQRGL